MSLNVFVSVDMEGITGIVHRDMLGSDQREYDRGRRLMTADANAAIEGLVKPGHHGTTFGGNPVACRLGLAVLDEIEEANLLDRVNEIGSWFKSQLLALQSRNASIVDIRGEGFMWGIELDGPAKPVVAELLNKGFVCGTARDNVIRLLPPYVTPKKAFAEFIDALEQVLAIVKEKAA